MRAWVCPITHLCVSCVFHVRLYRGVQELSVILKADVHGSMEAIVEALESAHKPSPEVRAIRFMSLSLSLFYRAVCSQLGGWSQSRR